MEERPRHGSLVVLMEQKLPPLAMFGNILDSTEFAVAAVGSRLCALRMVSALPTLPRPCAIDASKTCVIAGGSKVCHAMLPLGGMRSWCH